jgi:uncharacterized protein
MLSQKWETSKRAYGIIHDKDVAIPVRAGFNLDCDVLRPDSPDRFPVLLSMFPFDKNAQLQPHEPQAISPKLVMVEGGDYNFYVRRGYVQVFMNLRGTGKSGGVFDHMSPGTIEDVYDAIEWLAKQPWCDGQVATFGTSYFAMTAKRVAMLKPPSLKTIFAPFGVTDEYRQGVFQGGIFSFEFHKHWVKSLSNLRVRQSFPDKIGREEFDRRIQLALEDPEINIHADLVDTLKNPHDGANMHIVEYVLNYLDNEHFAEKAISFRQDITIPAYFGGCWGMHTLHLPGDFASWTKWSGPKKLTIGPPYYLDRPVYQYHNESLRWFDYWLKGIDTEIMDEAPINLFIRNTGTWKAAHQWPLPETKWTEFYLHQDGKLFEHEFFPTDVSSTFVEAPGEHGSLTFKTPMIVENTEVIGPLVLNFWASTTDTEVLWFVTLFQEDDRGVESILTRGWLRGSQRRVDPEHSTPWSIHHPHDRREPLIPNEIYEFNIELVPTGVLLKPGMRLGLRIKATDQDAHPTDFIDVHAYGHLWRETHQTVTIYHSNEYPSHLLVPVTAGNRLGTFASGGVMPAMEPH